MNALRVLLVDDSALLRRAMMSVLQAHAEIEVVAAVADGAAALSKLSEMPVDAVVLDVEMPGMNGLETLQRIRQKDERLPVVMFSALTERGAEVTVRALAAGASDYVCKPGGPQGLSAEDVISLQLVPKILALCGRRITRPLAAASPPLPLLRPTVLGRQVELLVIASSTGGPNALAELLPRLPAGLPVPVLIVQHMPPVFTRYLAERLNAAGPLPAREATDGELVSPGTIAVAPGDHHLEVTMRGNLLYTRLHQGPPENSCRPAADVLFRSAALAVGRGVLGVVLTGMGQDGLLGSQAIVDRGGSVLVQDEASCVVWGMPKAVEQAGLAEQVLPLGELSSAIALRCNRAGTRSAAGRR